ncbi:class I SAM-dependent methyltransferase [Rhizobium ruizarguesonis]|jgi:SAM-dependent methyltransferase|uniref:class I SAM-dependent methyltransferase n=1 Tax=Rhizobium ruizarguesonis TaxID=2081791 RepID=UPI0003786977|nr:class I SAM-dependent methyltransferase [Rhizobium ruizarguesonis]
MATYPDTSNTPNWQVSAPAIDYMSDEFARVYELTGARVTAPIAVEALRLMEPVPFQSRILDIGAGAGALSVPAAFSGASVVAVDIAPGMVRLLSDRLAPFPFASAHVMNGEDLRLPDNSFDLTFSILGISLFRDWEKGLSEMHRVLRSGGKACIASWKTLPGGGPFMVMAKALRTIFPDSPPPPASDAFVTLADPARVATAMQSAGFTEIKVVEFETIWKGYGGRAYLDAMRELHTYMAPYAALNDADRQKVDDAVLAIIEDYTVDSIVEIASPVLLAIAGKTSPQA